MTNAMRGTYGGKAATFYFHTSRNEVWYALEVDPGTGPTSGWVSVTCGSVDVTEATAQQFARIADAWRVSLRYLTSTESGDNIRAVKQQVRKYLERAAAAGVWGRGVGAPVPQPRG